MCEFRITFEREPEPETFARLIYRDARSLAACDVMDATPATSGRDKAACRAVVALARKLLPLFAASVNHNPPEHVARLMSAGWSPRCGPEWGAANIGKAVAVAARPAAQAKPKAKPAPEPSQAAIARKLEVDPAVLSRALKDGTPNKALAAGIKAEMGVNRYRPAHKTGRPSEPFNHGMQLWYGGTWWRDFMKVADPTDPAARALLADLRERGRAVPDFEGMRGLMEYLDSELISTTGAMPLWQDFERFHVQEIGHVFIAEAQLR